MGLPFIPPIYLYINLLILKIIFLLCFLVVDASQQFFHGSTDILEKKPSRRTRVTKMLCMTINPEEKRKIQGDIFVRVS